MTSPGQSKDSMGGQGPLSYLQTHLTAAFSAFPKVCSVEHCPCKMPYSRRVPWLSQFGKDPKLWDNQEKNDLNLWLIPKDGTLQRGE